jgi:pyridoxine/pyridoxamine 5'-phosphate oxidase
MAITRAEAAAFIRRHQYGVMSSLHESGGIESALVGVAVSDDLEIVFDTLFTSRKYANLRRDHRCAMVIGWENEQTLPIEGMADAPEDRELERLKKVYFTAWGDEGRARAAWPGTAYVRIRPVWLRFSDYNCRLPRADEATFAL